MGMQINTRSLESLNVTERRDWEGNTEDNYRHIPVIPIKM